MENVEIRVYSKIKISIYYIKTMGSVLAKLCKHFKCNSACAYNNDLFDIDIHNLSMNQFELKNKDILRIQNILNKRELKQSNNSSNKEKKFTREIIAELTEI